MSKSIVEIDELNLDKECVRLPSDYLKHANASSELKKKMDMLKAEFEVAQAEVSAMIRKNPEKYGLEKVTESGIHSAMLLSKRYRQAEYGLLEAKAEQDMAQNVVWALEHKKRSLTLLVELHGMGYFSNPKITREGKQAVDDMMKRKARRHRNED